MAGLLKRIICLLRHHTPFSSQHTFSTSAILLKIYGATVFKDDSIEVLDE